MNKRAVGYELVVFVTQWGLMLLGFGILTKFVAPLSLLNRGLSLGLYFDAAIKGLVALILSVTWLFIWDRQVRLYFHRRGKWLAPSENFCRLPMIPLNHCKTHVCILREPQIIRQSIRLGAVGYLFL